MIRLDRSKYLPQVQVCQFKDTDSILQEIARIESDAEVSSGTSFRQELLLGHTFIFLLSSALAADIVFKLLDNELLF